MKHRTWLLKDHYIYIFGAPKAVLTDQGSNFLSELMQQLEKVLQIQHVKTTAVHPQSNGNIERIKWAYQKEITNGMKTWNLFTSRSTP